MSRAQFYRGQQETSDTQVGLFTRSSGTRSPAPPCAIHPDDRVLVRAEDQTWWSGVSLDDFRGFENQDNMTCVAALKSLMQDHGLLADQAAKKVRLGFPFYYLTLEDRAKEHFHLSVDDAKLPYVLKGRVNRALKRLTGLQINRAALERASSMNALVRQLIRNGQI